MEGSMFSTLLESKGSRKAHSRWLPVSAVIHTALLAGVVTQSRSAQGREPDVHEPPGVVWVAPREHDTNASPRGGASGGATAEVQPQRRMPDFSSAPVVDLNDLAPAAAGESIGSSEALSLTTHFGVPGAGSGLSSGSGDGPRRAAQVDKVALPLSGNRVPDYPGALRSAGIEGGVTLRFVIDTLGAVERGSAVVVRSDHTLFTAAALRALATHRFFPAESGGIRVRMLVERRFEFALDAP